MNLVGGGGGRVSIGKKDGNVIKPVEGITISSGNVKESGAKTQFIVSVNASNITEAETFTLHVSVYNVLSNEFLLTIAESTLISSAVIVKAEDHGEVTAGTPGTLNYKITVIGSGGFPIQINSPDVEFFLDYGAPLPEGIAVNDAVITASGAATPFSFTVDVPAGFPNNYSIYTKVKGREANEPFALEVKPCDLFGDIYITITGTTLTAVTDALPGNGTISYQWQRSTNQEIFTDISGASSASYTVQPVDYENFIRVRIKRVGFTDSWLDSRAFGPIQDPSAPPLAGTVTVTGFAEVGKKLTASVSGISEGATAIYHWQRGSGTNFDFILGANEASYTVTSDDVGFTIRAVVSSLNFSGYLDSAPTAVVTFPTVAKQIAELYEIKTALPATYTVLVYDNEHIKPQELYFTNANDEAIEIEITLKGITSGKNLYLDLSDSEDGGAMFTVAPGVTLILENITLIGAPNNWFPLIDVIYGSLIINAGTVITGNTNQEWDYDLIDWMGGGVNNFGGYFVMNGGTITGNAADFGGGVMNYEGTFIMNGGTITDNYGDSVAGGIANFGYFEMYGGEISNNTGYYNGGGMMNYYIFEMYDGKISGNDTINCGGGVYVYWDSLFVMHGGVISGNTASYGGGVFNDYLFAMAGGSISANVSTDQWYEGGGGVENNGYFVMENGIIHGTNAPEHLKNKSNNPGMAAMLNTQSAEYGVFLDGYYNFEDENLTINGNLVTTDLTLEVINGVLVGKIAATSLIVTGLNTQYPGKTAELNYLDYTTFYPMAAPVTISASTNFTFIHEFPAAPAILQIIIKDGDDKIARHEGNITLNIGETTVGFSQFGDNIPFGADSLTITDLPLEDWHLQLQGGSDYYYWLAAKNGPITDSTVTMSFSSELEPGLSKFILQTFDSDEEEINRYYFELELVAKNNTISFNSIVSQNETLAPAYCLTITDFPFESIDDNLMFDLFHTEYDNWNYYVGYKYPPFTSEITIKFNMDGLAPGQYVFYLSYVDTDSWDTVGDVLYADVELVRGSGSTVSYNEFQVVEDGSPRKVPPSKRTIPNTGWIGEISGAKQAPSIVVPSIAAEQTPTVSNSADKFAMLESRKGIQPQAHKHSIQKWTFSIKKTKDRILSDIRSLRALRSLRSR